MHVPNKKNRSSTAAAAHNRLIINKLVNLHFDVYDAAARSCFMSEDDRGRRWAEECPAINSWEASIDLWAYTPVIFLG